MPSGSGAVSQNYTEKKVCSPIYYCKRKKIQALIKNIDTIKNVCTKCDSGERFYQLHAVRARFHHTGVLVRDAADLHTKEKMDASAGHMYVLSEWFFYSIFLRHTEVQVGLKFCHQ